MQANTKISKSLKDLWELNRGLCEHILQGTMHSKTMFNSFNKREAGEQQEKNMVVMPSHILIK